MSTEQVLIKDIGRASLIEYLGSNNKFGAEFEIVEKGLSRIEGNKIDYPVICIGVPENLKHNKINYFYADVFNEAYALNKQNFDFSENITLGRKKIIYYDSTGSNEKNGGNYNFIKDYPYGQYGKVPVENIIIVYKPPITQYGATGITITKSTPIFIDYSDSPMATVLINKNGYINHRIENSVNIRTGFISNIAEQYIVISGIFNYRKKGTTTYVQISFTGENVNIPANTLEDKTVYECYAIATVDDGQVVNSETVELTTSDTIPVLYTNSPKNQITYGEVNFNWLFSNESGGYQYAYDHQYSMDGINWIYLADHVISDQTNAIYTIPAGNNIAWRVRGYNSNDIVGEWSDIARFTNIAKPAKPTIKEVVGSGRPIIKWEAETQIAFEVEVIGQYNSGQVYSSVKEFKINKYLGNGVYTIRVRIYNQFSQASDWVSIVYQQNMNLTNPLATSSITENGVLISITKEDKFSKYYLLRDDILIHKFIDDEYEYEDIFIHGDTNYIVRGVTINDNFSDTLIQEKFSLRKSQIITLDGYIFELSTRLDNKPIHNFTTNKDIYVANFLGRSEPVHFVGTIENKTYSVTCHTSFNKKGEIVFYRNYFGDADYVVCTSISVTNSDILNETQLTLVKTSYNPGISYE